MIVRKQWRVFEISENRAVAVTRRREMKRERKSSRGRFEKMLVVVALVGRQNRCAPKPSCCNFAAAAGYMPQGAGQRAQRRKRREKQNNGKERSLTWCASVDARIIALAQTSRRDADEMAVDYDICG